MQQQVPRLIDVDSQVVEMPDAYARLVDLLGIPALRGRVYDATMRALSATVEVRYQESAPGSGDAGDQLAAGAGYGSPWVWRVERIWLREFVAAAGAKVVFGGTIAKDP